MKIFAVSALQILAITFAANIQAQSYCGDIQTEKEITQVIAQIRDSILPLLPQHEINKINQEVSKYPKVNQKKEFLIEFDLVQIDEQITTSLTPKRRDWALALIGLEYTFLGGYYDAYSAYLDLGFWSFLEAALINLEPNHLANIGFHLNNKGKYKTARKILCYAQSVNDNLFEVHNNLSFSLASLGQVADAFGEAQKSLNLKPDSVHVQKRYTEFAQINNIDLKAQHKALGYVPDETGFGGGPPSPAFMKLFSVLAPLNNRIQKELSGNFIKYVDEAGYPGH